MSAPNSPWRGGYNNAASPHRDLSAAFQAVQNLNTAQDSISPSALNKSLNCYFASNGTNIKQATVGPGLGPGSLSNSTNKIGASNLHSGSPSPKKTNKGGPLTLPKLTNNPLNSPAKNSASPAGSFLSHSSPTVARAGVNTVATASARTLNSNLLPKNLPSLNVTNTAKI